MKLKIDNISRGFDKKTVIKDASFEFEKGHIYALLGKNGAGKTTLFNCISESLKLEGGSITLIGDGGEELNVGNNVGFAYSTPMLPEFLTGLEFIKFYKDIHGSVDPKTPDEYMEEFLFSPEDRTKLIREYSQGMKNKLQMMSLFISNQPVILLDEPMTSLDLIAAHEIKELLLRMQEDHIIILSTHIMQLANDICDRIVLLNNHKLSAVEFNEGNRDELEAYILEALREDYKNEADE